MTSRLPADMAGDETIRLRCGTVITRAQLQKIISLRNDGMTPKEAARIVGVSERAVREATKNIAFRQNWIGNYVVDHDAFVAAAAENDSYADLARLFDMPYSIAREYCRRYRVKLRNRTTDAPDRNLQAQTTPQIVRAIEMGVSEGYSNRAIAAILGINRDLVAKIAKKARKKSGSGDILRGYDPGSDTPANIIKRRWLKGKSARSRPKMPEHIVIQGPPEFYEVALPLRRLGYIVYPLDNKKYDGLYHCGPRDVDWKTLCRLSREAAKKLGKMKNG